MSIFPLQIYTLSADIMEPYLFPLYYCFIDLVFREANTKWFGTFDSSPKRGEN